MFFIIDSIAFIELLCFFALNMWDVLSDDNSMQTTIVFTK